MTGISVRSVACAGISALSLMAVSSPLKAEDWVQGWEAGVRASTLGLGVEVKRNFGEQLAVRGVFNGFTYGLDDEYSDVAYDGDLNLRSGGLLVDWHPGGSSFRLTAGLLLNGNELDIDAEPIGGTYEFNGAEYDATQIGSASGKAEFDDVAPYLGLGFASRAEGGGFTFNADLGVLFQGSPSFELDVRCDAAVPSLVCDQIQEDAEAERAEFEDDADEFEYYPVLSIGLGYTW